VDDRLAGTAAAVPGVGEDAAHVLRPLHAVSVSSAT
jgi:hypothetical protein